MNIENLLLTILLSYCSIVISDFIVHKYIMHGDWKFVREPTHSLAENWLHPHYIQHMKAHHPLAYRFKSELAEGKKVPRQSQIELEERLSNFKRALTGTEHGITIKDKYCFLSFVSLFLLTPHCIVTPFIWIYLGQIAGIISLLMVCVPAFNHMIHRYYHMDKKSRAEQSTYPLKLYINSKFFDEVAINHQKHHLEEDHFNDYFNLLPLGYYILRPLLAFIKCGKKVGIIFRRSKA